MKKNIILAVLALGLSIVSFSYEDYYEKVYTVKVSKVSLYNEIGATEKQERKLERLFKKYQKKADNLENKLLKFDNKKKELGKIEAERYVDISRILTEEQMKTFNMFINNKKSDFEEKNDKIKNLIDSLSLTNEQKAEISRYERTFQKAVNSREMTSLAPERYASEYEKARNDRNDKMKSILTEEQIRIIENTN